MQRYRVYKAVWSRMSLDVLLDYRKVSDHWQPLLLSRETVVSRHMSPIFIIMYCFSASKTNILRCFCLTASSVKILCSQSDLTICALEKGCRETEERYRNQLN